MRVAPLLLILILVGCNQQITGMAVSGTGAHNKTVLFIVPPQEFRYEELAVPRRALVGAGYVTRIATLTTAAATDISGTKVQPDYAVGNVSASDFEMVVVVAGKGDKELSDDPAVLSLLQEAESKHIFIAAIDRGVTVLAKADILKNRRVTVFPSDDAIQAVEDSGAVILNEQVVRQGNIITANGAAASGAFAEELVNALGE